MLDFSQLPIERILENLTNNVYVLDRDHRIVWCNDQQARYCGLSSKDELIGKSIHDMAKILNSPADWAESIMQNNREIMESGEMMISEEKVLIDGNPHYFLAHKNALRDNQGNIIGIIGIGVNITEKKEKEILQQEKARVEETLESLQMLAASIAHELRTPLVGAKAGVNALEKYLPMIMSVLDSSKDFPGIRHSRLRALQQVLPNIDSQLDQALMFIELSMANLKVRKVDTSSFAEISIRDTVNSALADYPFQPTEINLIDWDVTKSENFSYRGNLQLSKHILYNLLRNAIYFVKASGRDGKVDIKTQLGKPYNQLIITDSGQGIKPEQLKKIFDLFYTNREMGTGVGLAYCKMVMDAYGGEIECDSVYGEYTQFRLKFPVL